MSVKVSIVIPVYKTAKYLPQCLDSVLQSKLTEIEIICVDDGSPDESGKILDSYALKDGRIRVIHQQNKGAGSAYNAGRNMATGEYITYLDSDDWVDSNMYFDLYGIAKNTHADVVKSGSCFLEYETHQGLSVQIFPQKCYQMITETFKLPEFVTGQMMHWSALYRRQFIVENKIYHADDKKDIASEISFIYHVWIKAKSIFVIPKPYYHYRLTNPNADTKQNTRMSFYLLDGHRAASRIMGENHVTDKRYWMPKVKSEFDYFKGELDQRCYTKRYKFISEFSKIFRDRLKKRFVTQEDLGEYKWKELNRVAKHPVLYYLNSTTRFWYINENFINRQKISYKLFGLFKIKQNLVSKKYYCFGICYWSERLYDADFENLNKMCIDLQHQIKLLQMRVKSEK